MSKRKHISVFILDYEHVDVGIVVRSDSSDADNRKRVAALCPWAAVIQRQNMGYGAYEDPADAKRARKREEKMGVQNVAA